MFLQLKWYFILTYFFITLYVNTLNRLEIFYLNNFIITYDKIALICL